jgi:hypothetical protein
LAENHRYLNNFFEYFFYFLFFTFFYFYFFLFFFAGPNPAHMAGLDPSQSCVAGLDSASPAWSLAHASDHLQKGIPLLGLETGSLE